MHKQEELAYPLKWLNGWNFPSEGKQSKTWCSSSSRRLAGVWVSRRLIMHLRTKCIRGSVNELQSYLVAEVSGWAGNGGCLPLPRSGGLGKYSLFKDPIMWLNHARQFSPGGGIRIVHVAGRVLVKVILASLTVFQLEFWIFILMLDACRSGW